MARVAYRLWAIKTIENVEESFLFDVDEDYTSKTKYIKAAKEYTKQFNEEFGTSYTYEEVFGYPIDFGYRYCSKCDTYFWSGDPCECEEW